MHGMTVKII